jgi:glycosyltransferase involved in cell wall biosynthesis
MFKKIDLIITVFNKEKYISRALNSALSQYKCKFNKIIIVNDGSTDLSQKVIENKLKNNSNIKLINIQNSGVSEARNIGTKYSEAEYIVYLDADDELNEEYLFEINRLIKSYPDCRIFSTIHQNIYDHRNKKNEIFKINKNDLKISLNPIKNFIFNFNIICSSGICILKKEIEKFSFPKNIAIGEDIYLWLKLFSVNKFAWSNRPLIYIYKDALDRTQNTRFVEIPYYLKKRNEILSLYEKKLFVKIYFFISFFINYFKLHNLKKMQHDLLLLKKEYKLNNFILNVTPHFLLHFIYYFLSLIRHDLSKFFYLIASFFSPNLPLFFVFHYLFNNKASAVEFLIIQSYLILLISSFSFFTKIILFRNFRIQLFFESISFRIILMPFLFLLIIFINNFFKFNFFNLFLLFFYIILLWLCEIQLIFFIKRKLYLKYILLILFLTISFIFILYISIEHLKYYFIFSLFIFLIYFLFNIKIFLFSFKYLKFFIYKFYSKISTRNFFISNIFNNINNFYLRFLISISFLPNLVSDYFFFLFLLALPISFLNNTYSEYVISIYKNEKIFYLISSFFIFTIFISYLIFYSENLIGKEILFFNYLAASFFIYINIIRLRMLSSDLKFNQLSILDIRSSILFTTVLLFAFFKRDALLYVYFINSIFQILIFRKYFKLKI